MPLKRGPYSTLWLSFRGVSYDFALSIEPSVYQWLNTVQVESQECGCVWMKVGWNVEKGITLGAPNKHSRVIPDSRMFRWKEFTTFHWINITHGWTMKAHLIYTNHNMLGRLILPEQEMFDANDIDELNIVQSKSV